MGVCSLINTINYVLRHGKRRPTDVGDVLTRFKVHKSVGSLDFSLGADSDVNEGTLSCDGIIALLSGLYVRTKLDLTMLVEVQSAACDYAFGADGVEHPIFSGDGLIPKYGDEE